MRQYIFAYYSNWFASWVIKQAVPSIDIRMSKFRRLRIYAKGTFKSQKYKFLQDKLYTYFLTMFKDYPQFLEFDYDDPKDRNTFKELVEPQITAYFFQEVFSYIAPYINYQVIFGNKKDLPYFYFKSVIMSLSIWVYYIIKSEAVLNCSRSPGLVKRKDENARSLYRKIFDSFIFNLKFIEVERGIFKKILLELIIP